MGPTRFGYTAWESHKRGLTPRRLDAAPAESHIRVAGEGGDHTAATWSPVARQGCASVLESASQPWRSRKARSTGIVSRLCLLLAFAGVLAGAAAVDDTATPVAQPLGERACKGELQFGTEIAVRDVRTATVVPDAIVFDRRDGHVHATVKAGRYTWPKARCQIDVELRDSRDTVLASSHAILESCGEIISFPGVSHAPFAFPLGREEALTEATHFVLRLLPLVPVPRPVIGARPRKASPGEATESSGEALSELRRELKGDWVLNTFLSSGRLLWIDTRLTQSMTSTRSSMR